MTKHGMKPLGVLIRALFPAGIDESAFRHELEGRN